MANLLPRSHVIAIADHIQQWCPHLKCVPAPEERQFILWDQMPSRWRVVGAALGGQRRSPGVDEHRRRVTMLARAAIILGSMPAYPAHPAHPTSAETIATAIQNGVARITLNRPDALNAFAGDMRERLVAALDRVASDASARVLVITGAGRAFCAGGDVKVMESLVARGASFDELAPLLGLGRSIVTRIHALPFPTIAALNGPAAGAGMNLALACDIRWASDEASFGETFVQIGLHPDWGGTYFLPRLVGVSRALELCWTGAMIGADEAQRLGLVSRVVPAATFAEEVDRFAQKLVIAPQASVRAAKRTLRASLARDLEQCLDAEEQAQAECWASPDVAEGLRAFVEKRRAQYGAAAPVVASPRFE